MEDARHDAGGRDRRLRPLLVELEKLAGHARTR